MGLGAGGASHEDLRREGSFFESADPRGFGVCKSDVLRAWQVPGRELGQMPRKDPFIPVIVQENPQERIPCARGCSHGSSGKLWIKPASQNPANLSTILVILFFWRHRLGAGWKEERDGRRNRMEQLHGIAVAEL